MAETEMSRLRMIKELPVQTYGQHVPGRGPGMVGLIVAHVVVCVWWCSVCGHHHHQSLGEGLN